MEFFSDAWAGQLCRRLNRSDAYAAAASSWEGAVVLEDIAQPEERAVFLDLWRGACRGSRVATEADKRDVAYVLTATHENWLRILEELSPVTAILSGKLRLTKGSLSALMPHMKAANELVMVARSVGSASPSKDPRPGLEVPSSFGASPVVPVVPVVPVEGGRSEASEAPSTSGPRVFQTTSDVGLDFESVPMQLWEKAKRLGVWNPAEIDFTQDRADWESLDEMERDLLRRLTSLFMAGEESVTLDLLPLMRVIGAEGRLEEEMYLTSFLWEEAKHVEVFARFFQAIGELHVDQSHFHSPCYRKIFYEELPAAMGALRTDASPIAQARASVTYNLIVEGVLAETGYHVYHEVLTSNGILPGMQRASALLKQDESRHLAYGVHLLSRLVREHGDPVWRAIEARMDDLLEPATGIIAEAFSAYEPGNVPFGLEQGAFVEFAEHQFRRRIEHVERARS